VTPSSETVASSFAHLPAMNQQAESSRVIELSKWHLTDINREISPVEAREILRRLYEPTQKSTKEDYAEDIVTMMGKSARQLGIAPANKTAIITKKNLQIFLNSLNTKAKERS